ETLPTSSCSVPIAVRLFDTTTLPFRSSGRKPLASTRIVYSPATSAGKEKSPVSLVVPMRSSPEDCDVSLTVAPGMSCPLGSATVPESDPVVICAAADMASTSIDTRMQTNFFISCLLTPRRFLLRIMQYALHCCERNLIKGGN